LLALALFFRASHLIIQSFSSTFSSSFFISFAPAVAAAAHAVGPALVAAGQALGAPAAAARELDGDAVNVPTGKVHVQGDLQNLGVKNIFP
jgi:hypothetical protein